jgi:phosphoglycerate dehydrogenase-like enzyme
VNVLIIKGLTLSQVSDEQLAQIREAAGPGSNVRMVQSLDEAIAAADETEVILGVITPKLFAAAPRLRWVHAIASGVDFFLFPEFRDSDVVLTGEKGLVGSHLADHAFALLLAHARQLASAVRAGPAAWSQRRELREREFELEGLTMGIIGFGGTGRAVARRAAAFGMPCRAVDLFAMEGSSEVDRVEPIAALPRLLAESDVVAVCAPLTRETRGMLGDAEFAQMKPTAILVNVSRGEIVDGAALVRALREGRIAGAALDVVPEEPLPEDHPLWSMENVVMTPHTAGASQHRTPRNIDRFCQNLVRMRRGVPLLGLVDKQAGF